MNQAKAQAEADTALCVLQHIAEFEQSYPLQVGHFVDTFIQPHIYVDQKAVADAKAYIGDILMDLLHAPKTEAQEAVDRYYGAQESRHERIESENVRSL